MSTRLSLGKSTPAIRAIVPPRSPATRSLSFYSSMGWLGWPLLRTSSPVAFVKSNGYPAHSDRARCVSTEAGPAAPRSSPLPLLVSGILTQDSDHTPTPDNPALRANRLHRRLHFHGLTEFRVTSNEFRGSDSPLVTRYSSLTT